MWSCQVWRNSGDFRYIIYTCLIGKCPVSRNWFDYLYKTLTLSITRVHYLISDYYISSKMFFLLNMFYSHSRIRNLVIIFLLCWVMYVVWFWDILYYMHCKCIVEKTRMNAEIPFCTVLLPIPWCWIKFLCVFYRFCTRIYSSLS